MIIDANTYIGHWPFRRLRYNTVEGLVKLMDRCGVDKTVCGSINSVFYKDCQEGNEELAEDVDEYPERIIPFATVNPAYVAWREDLERSVKDLGMKGLRIYPLYHNYSLADPRLGELLKEAAALRVPVEIPLRIVDVRQRHWMDVTRTLTLDEVAGLVKAYPENHFILLNGIGYEKTQFAEMKQNNYRIEISRLTVLLTKTIPRLIETLGASKLVFGTGMPFSYPEPALLKMELLEAGLEVKEAIYWRNLAEFLQ